MNYLYCFKLNIFFEILFYFMTSLHKYNQNPHTHKKNASRLTYLLDAHFYTVLGLIKNTHIMYI